MRSKHLPSSIQIAAYNDRYLFLPVWWDLTATFLYALVGTRFAIMRGYDVVGVLMISLIVSVGGGLLRDILLQAGPPVALRDPMYTAMAWGAAVVGLVLYKKVPRLQAHDRCCRCALHRTLWRVWCPEKYELRPQTSRCDLRWSPQCDREASCAMLSSATNPKYSVRARIMPLLPSLA
ncbi:MAG: TRIC cation channel family protein [Ignavibacteria bacterium]|nr:TRIC cation channel family protein [Ignavibacteria bacterium]